MDRDLTVSEVLFDPLIAQMRKADAIGYASFAQFMQSAGGCMPARWSSIFAKSAPMPSTTPSRPPIARRTV